MATFTDQMQRLTEDLVDFRGARVAFVGRLAPDVRRFRDDFRTRFDAESRAGREQRHGFVARLAQNLAEFLGDFRTTFEQAARAGREQRGEFVANVQQSSSTLLETFRRDLAAVRRDITGASQAWKKFAAGTGNGPVTARRSK